MRCSKRLQGLSPDGTATPSLYTDQRSSLNWGDFPNEVKCLIIAQLDKNSRLSLRSCSRNDMRLVDSVPFRKIYKLKLKLNSSGGEISFRYRKLTLHPKVSYKYHTIEKLQEKIFSITANVRYIGILNICATSDYSRLQLKQNMKKLHVNRAIVSKWAVHILHQIEPLSLNFLYIAMSEDKGENIKFTKLPQCLLEKDISVSASYKLDVSFAKLVNCLSILVEPEHFTANGISRLIEVSIDELVLWEFHIEGINRFKIDDISTGFHYNRKTYMQFDELSEDDDDDSTMEKYDKLGVYSDIKNREYSIETAGLGYINWDPCSSGNELKRELAKMINEGCRIEQFSVDEGTDNWKWLPGIKKINAEQLTIEGGGEPLEDVEMVIKLVGIIEPKHLKCITIGKVTNCNSALYNTLQFINAEQISMIGSNLNDKTLLKLNASQLKFSDSYLTASGINKLLKKWSLQTNEKDYYIEFDRPCARRRMNLENFVRGVLDGLETLSHERLNNVHTVVVRTCDPDYFFKLSITDTTFNLSTVETDLL